MKVRKNGNVILRRSEKAMSGVTLIDKRDSQKLIDVLPLKETADRPL